MIKSGHAEHAILGLDVETIDASLAKTARGLPARGVIARVAQGSPAAKAGLEAAIRHATTDGVTVLLGCDAIVAVHGKSVSTSQQRAWIVAAHRPGDRLKLDVVRAGARRAVTVTLGDVATRTS